MKLYWCVMKGVGVIPAGGGMNGVGVIPAGGNNPSMSEWITIIYPKVSQW